VELHDLGLVFHVDRSEMLFDSIDVKEVFVLLRRLATVAQEARRGSEAARMHEHHWQRA